MRQVFLQKGSIALKKVCEPVLSDHSMLISVYHSLIIPETERSIIEASEKESLLKNIPEKIRLVFDSISTKNIDGLIDLARKGFHGEIKSLGHSCSGRVIAVGSKVTQFRSGDFVACAGNGFANHADIICVPEHFAVKIKNKSLLQEASFIAIGALAFDAIKKSDLKIGQTVCIVGMDILGQLIAQIAKLSGCKVIAIDNNEAHLHKAHEFGVSTVLHAKSENLEQQISYITNHTGADCVIVTKHIDHVLPQAINFSKQQGRIVFVQYKKQINLNQSQLYKKEINIISIPSMTQEEIYLSENQLDLYDYLTPLAQEHCKSLHLFMDLLEDNLISVKGLISHSLSINNATDAYKLATNKDIFGLILNFLPKPETTLIAPSEKKNSYIPARKDFLSVGILGAGASTKDTLLPILSKIKNVKIDTTVDRSIVKSMNIAQIYGARKTIINENELFNDQNIDLVFINMPYRTHYIQAIEAIKQGKAVFLEGPMASDLNQLGILYDYLQTNKSAQFCVDYSTSFAPFIKKIEFYTKQRTSPLMISYRINTGFIAKDQWLKKQMSSGRLIGEAGHIFELFLHLVDSQPVSVSVESLKITNSYLFPTDNFSAQVSFADGSICSLLYTSLGHVSVGKERMEIFFDSKSIIMDDYISLEGFGLPFSFNETVKKPNKGYEALVNNFLKAIKQDVYVPPISIERLNKATELTLIIDQLALQGGGEHTLIKSTTLDEA